jgi:predicted transcriptional regulator of viral defense system
VTHDPLTTKNAVALGTSKARLSRGARSGRYDRIARGIYRPSGAGPADLDLVEAAARRPDATICLMSALAHHGLTDEIPVALDVAIPRGTRIPVTEGAISWHVFDKASFSIGREEITIPGTDDLRIGLYSPERCIADAYRLRGELGYETSTHALRTWLTRGGRPALLVEIADQLPRASAPLMQALSTLT